ncbi:MAG: hypothetical protein ACXWLZ_08180 [Rhizomicrobium sp.]
MASNGAGTTRAEFGTKAAKFTPRNQLGLGPQCGFASIEEGGLIAEDEEWRKLALVVETSREVWE